MVTENRQKELLPALSQWTVTSSLSQHDDAGL